jgi:hypothetical protein
MAAAVVSGSTALLLELQRNLAPRETKALVQLTSSQMRGEGLVTVGAGSLNVLAASDLLGSKNASPLTDIAGEPVRRSGIAFENSPENQGPPQLGSLRSLINNRMSGAVWSTVASDTIIWSTNDTIIWSTAAESDTIIWSTFQNDTIIWSTSTIDTIIWSTNDRQSDTIIWSTSDTIIWSTSDTIIWSTAHLNDTIIWSTFLQESALDAAESYAL